MYSCSASFSTLPFTDVIIVQRSYKWYVFIDSRESSILGIRYQFIKKRYPWKAYPPGKKEYFLLSILNVAIAVQVPEANEFIFMGRFTGIIEKQLLHAGIQGGVWYDDKVCGLCCLHRDGRSNRLASSEVKSSFLSQPSSLCLPCSLPMIWE